MTARPKSRLKREEMAALAKTAVEKKLRLSSIIAEKEVAYLSAIADSHRDAGPPSGQSNLSFFAAVIPWVSSFIQVYAKQTDYVAALAWASNQPKRNEKPVSLLTTLMTTYFIERGYERSLSQSKEDKDTWAAIRHRLDYL
ncbi:MAG TPA: hypothetical protein P5567_07710 [Kiritimatiellia bacterium]|nr:hypothetical protein [Kiritimatiellia bacterium]HRZ12324.1 hypothetical protein [Kiritimatiellia bacterium]HSA17918.1 hypothetical protein [Kiritimatiellia bacterium]